MQTPINPLPIFGTCACRTCGKAVEIRNPIVKAVIERFGIKPRCDVCKRG